MNFVPFQAILFLASLFAVVCAEKCSPMIRCVENNIPLGSIGKQPTRYTECHAYIWDGNKVNKKAEFEENNGNLLKSQETRTFEKYGHKLDFYVKHIGGTQITKATFQRQGGGDVVELQDHCETWRDFYGVGTVANVACMVSNIDC